MKKELKDFVKRNKPQLRELFLYRVGQLKERVFSLQKGEERDFLIEFIREYERFWKLLFEEEKEKDFDNFI